jgi:ribosome-binding protein aMBF1 (putative translation factor)
MLSNTEAKEASQMAQGTSKDAVSPAGSTVAEAAAGRARRSAGYREARERLAPYEQLARIVLRRRIDLQLTQEQLAERMGTSHSAISRIESGQHSTSVQTLQRLATALEMRFVMGFEHGPAEKPVRELVPA